MGDSFPSYAQAWYMVRVSALFMAECWQCRYVLKNLVRDWSEEGAPERAQSYGRILAELQARYPVRAPLDLCYSTLFQWSGHVRLVLRGFGMEHVHVIWVCMPCAGWCCARGVTVTGGSAMLARVCQPSRLAEGAEPPWVLVPGAGLGRLCLDIARLGFRAEV